MITKNLNHKDINTVLLNTYRKLNEAKEYNSNFFFNMATIDGSLQSMTTALKSMWQSLVAYENQKNALSHLLYSKIQDLYDKAVAAINRWNEDLDKGPILLEQYNAKVAEWQKAVAEASALYAELETMTTAYNTWYNDIYLPTYQTYEATKATAYQARDANLALKETTWRNYYNSDFYTNWIETEDFYHYVYDEPTSDPYATLGARLREIQLYPDQNVVIRTCFTYVYDTDMNRHTLKYILRLSRLSIDAGVRFVLSYEYEYDYASPVTMDFSRSANVELFGPRNVPSEAQASMVSDVKSWLNDSSMPNALYYFKAVHDNAVTVNNNTHAQMDQYQANADAYQNQIDDLNNKEDELTNQKNDLWDKVVDKDNEYKAKAKEATNLQIESLKLLWEYNGLAAKTQQDYIDALTKSAIYNQAVIKATQEQIAQGKTPVPYPKLPEPFNLSIIYIDPKTGEPVYPDMPSKPVPEPSPYPPDPYHGH
jgi:predicted  nucleic acid-binding Zn-ribbon protein